MRVLDARNITVREELRVVEHDGFRRIWNGDRLLADDSDEQWARVARFALVAAPLTGKSVAWIGGGLCVGPRLFAIADCTQTVYELEPALREFCPVGVTFMPGDWRDAIRGQFDLIVYDLGGNVPREELAKHLAANGVILP